MPERSYLGIVNIHGRVEVVKSQDLRILQEELDRVLSRPRVDYPHFDFQPEIFNVRSLKRKERKFLDSNSNNISTL
jgi:hypothetical protein